MDSRKQSAKLEVIKLRIQVCPPSRAFIRPQSLVPLETLKKEGKESKEKT